MRNASPIVAPTRPAISKTGQALLLLLWAVALGAPAAGLLLAGQWLVFGGVLGAAALAVLVARVFIQGFRTFEWMLGLRILRRKEGSRWLRIGPLICIAGGALASLLIWLGTPVARGGYEVAALAGPQIRLMLIAFVLICTLVALILALARRFSIFGTISICGVVVGVAALVVVQSVASGFQQDFEKRLLGVYAQINVTRTNGIADYRRFESWLGTVDNVTGVSPWVYHYLAIAPQRSGGSSETASVLVKGIEPETADSVMDLSAHLKRGSHRDVSLLELRSHFVPAPASAEQFEWVPEAVESSTAVVRPSLREIAQRDPLAEPDLEDMGDQWLDPPEVGEELAGNLDASRMPTMFVGFTLANELGIKENDVVRLVDPGASFDRSQEPKTRNFRVAAIFHAGFQEFDSRLVYVDIRELQRVKYGGQDLVSGIDLRLTSPALAGSVGGEIRQELGGRYSVVEWQDLNENLFFSIRSTKNVLTVLLSLVMFVATFNVVSALWTMVVRRTPEIAILMSMGATSGQIARIFQVTGVAIGLAGALAGVIFGLVMCEMVHLYGYSLDPQVYFIDELPVVVDPKQVTAVLVFALVACYIATIPPSLRAARLRPVEGLRYDA